VKKKIMGLVTKESLSNAIGTVHRCKEFHFLKFHRDSFRNGLERSDELFAIEKKITFLVTKESLGEYDRRIELSVSFNLRQLRTSAVENWLRTGRSNAHEDKDA
jgi:hypothetical protein